MPAIEAMAKISGGSVILIEPVPELYGWSLHGITSRLRAIVIDHVRHIVPALKWAGYTVERASRLGLGSPLTEACIIVAHKKI